VIVIIPLLVALIGLLLWVLSTNPTLKDIGRILFCIGTFVAVFRSGDASIKIL
jgi:hypothetical protein